jgi:hypothetical protein
VICFKSRAALLGLLLLTWPAAAGAETISEGSEITDTSQFAKFLASEPQLRVRAQIAALEDRSVGRVCKDKYMMGKRLLKVVSPIEIDDATAVPKAGQWVERFKIVRCGRESDFNAIFRINEEGKLEVKPAAPGETAQNLQLVIDLRPIITRQAKIENCPQRGLLDTALGPPEGYEPKVPEGVYETWTVSGCGKDVDMVLLFTPQQDGQTNVQVERQIPR